MTVRHMGLGGGTAKEVTSPLVERYRLPDTPTAETPVAREGGRIVEGEKRTYGVVEITDRKGAIINWREIRKRLAEMLFQ